MTATPWSQLVTKTPARVKIIGGHPGAGVKAWTPTLFVCWNERSNRLEQSTDGWKTHCPIEPYDFSPFATQHQGSKALYVHPSALAHLYVQRLVSPDEVGRFAVSIRVLMSTSEPLQQVVSGGLAHLFGAERLMLVLRTTFDLSAQ